MQELKCPYCEIFDEYHWYDIQTAKDMLADHVRRKHMAAPKELPLTQPMSQGD